MGARQKRPGSRAVEMNIIDIDGTTLRLLTSLKRNVDH